MQKLKKILLKINLTFICLSLFGAIISIVVFLPLNVYDEYVITNDKKCYDDELSKEIATAKSKLSNSKWIDDAVFISGEDNAAKKCNVRLSRYSNETSVYSKRTVISNSPNIQFSITFAGFFIGLALFLYLIQKWISWLAKD